MGDTTGQAADALQALGCQGLRLQPLLLGDVGVDGQPHARPAVGVAQQRLAAVHSERHAEARYLLQFAVPVATFQEATMQGGAVGRRGAVE